MCTCVCFVCTCICSATSIINVAQTFVLLAFSLRKLKIAFVCLTIRASFVCKRRGTHIDRASSINNLVELCIQRLRPLSKLL